MRRQGKRPLPLQRDPRHLDIRGVKHEWIILCALPAPTFQHNLSGLFCKARVTATFLECRPQNRGAVRRKRLGASAVSCARSCTLRSLFSLLAGAIYLFNTVLYFCGARRTFEAKKKSQRNEKKIVCERENKKKRPRPSRVGKPQPLPAKSLLTHWRSRRSLTQLTQATHSGDAVDAADAVDALDW